MIAAWSLLAEPFSAPDVPAMMAMYDRLYDALRADGDRHLMVIHDGFKGLPNLPTAATMGWVNVVYSTHMFEWGARTLAAHQVTLRRYEGSWALAQRRQGVPYFVGSFSTMADEPWAYDAYDVYPDTYARRGWSWSMWAWKRVDDELERSLDGTQTSWGVWRTFRADAGWVRADLCHDDLDTLVARVARTRTSLMEPSPELDRRFRRGVALP